VNSYLRQVAFAGLVISLGVAIPLAIHATGAGNIGRVLLPMFLPVVAGAFFLTPGVAVFVGAVTPYVSALSTGMPPIFPIGVLMSVELALISGIISVMYGRLGINIWLALGTAMLADRALLALLAAGLAPALGLPQNMVTWVALLYGLPGFALQLLIVPPLVRRLHHAAASNAHE
jgi:hypothetical protein